MANAQSIDGEIIRLSMTKEEAADLKDLLDTVVEEAVIPGKLFLPVNQAAALKSVLTALQLCPT